jgi:hypothetical protein
MLSWKCPACGGRLSAPDRLVGRTAPCVHCRAPVTVPAPDAPGARHVPDAPTPAAAMTTPRTAATPVQPAVPPPAATRAPLPERTPQAGAPPAPPRAVRRLPRGSVGLATVLLVAGLGYTTWSRTAARPQPPAGPVVDAVVAPPLQPPGAPVPAPSAPAGGMSREQLEAAGLVDDARWQEHRARNQVLASDRATRITVTADGTVLGPADPASPAPAAAAPSDPPADSFDADAVPPTAGDYVALATMSSQFVRRDGRLVRLDPDEAALERLRSSKSLRARELGRRAEEALRDYIRADVANKQAAQQEEAALGGFLGSVFSGDSDTLVASEMEMPGMMRIESLSSHYASQALAAGIAAVQGRFTATELFDRADEARLALWQELFPESARHAGAAVAPAPPVRVEIVRTAQTEFDGVFEFLRESLRGKTLHVYGVRATNESGRDLTNVTLRLTLEAVPPPAEGRQPGLPDATLAEPNHYFVASWPAGATVELLTGRHWGSDGIRRSHAGVLDVFAAELRHEGGPLAFDDNLRAYVADTVHGWGLRLDRGHHDEVLTQTAALAAALPARLPDVVQAVGETAAAARRSREERERLVAATRPGRDWSGRWVCGRFAAPLAIRFVSDRSRPQAAEGDVTAEVFLPEEPSLYRRCAGSIDCRRRVWHVRLTGLADSGPRGIDSTGTERVFDAPPAASQLLERNLDLQAAGRALVCRMADAAERLEARTAIGEEVTWLPAGAAGLGELLASQPPAPSIERPRQGEPLPAALLPPALSAPSYDLAGPAGEVVRGRHAESGLYGVDQVLLATRQPHAVSWSERMGTGFLWSFAPDEPARKNAAAQPAAAGIVAGKGPLPLQGPLAASADLERIVSRGDEGALLFWKTQSRQPPTPANLGAADMALFTAGDTDLLVTVSPQHELAVFNDRLKRLFARPLPLAPQAIGCAPDGSYVAAVTDGRLFAWNVPGGAARFVAAVPPPRGEQGSVEIMRIVPAPDGRRLLLVGRFIRQVGLRLDDAGLLDAGVLVPREQAEVFITVVDADTGAPLATTTLPTAATALAVSADWRTLVTAEPAGPLAVWDLATGRERAVLVGHQRPSRAVAVAPCGRFAVSAASDFVIFWRIDPVDAAGRP